ncbi:MAG: gluconeogenesis factor YvcK family protein [Anaerolineae bacterium]
MQLRKKIGSAWKWLYPGMGIKRWLALLAMGLLLLSLGVSFFYVQIYRSLEFTGPISPVAYTVTLQFLPRWLRGVILAVLGTICVAVAVVRLSRSLVSALFESDRESVVDVIYRRRMRKRGPKIVAVGGGTGLSTLLRGLKDCTDNLTAVVTVADDGGSSGRLRRELGLLPPGDFRNCITALAEAEPLMTLLFEYRFGQGQGLNGHSFGNLFIAAMAGVTGDFGQAIRQSSKVLAVRGRVLPSTMHSVTLCAELAELVDGREAQHQVEGESRIPKAGAPIERVFLQPDDVRGYGESVQALLDADIIVVGPGSLYTSILPNLLVKDITAAIRASTALRIYVCNLATQAGETDGYNAADHVRALYNHVGEGLFDYVLLNDNLEVQTPENWNAEMVKPITDGTYRVWTADVVDRNKPWRHDPAKLAQSIMHIYANYRQMRNHRLAS